MPLTINQPLQDQLSKIPEAQRAIALLVQLRGNDNPTPEEIRQAMEDVESGNTRPLKEEEREAVEREARRQMLLAEMKRLHDIPDRGTTMDDFNQMRGIRRSLRLLFPEEMEKPKRKE